MSVFFKQLLLNLLITLISSLPLYGMYKLGLFSFVQSGIYLSFFISLIIYMVLSGLRLKNNLFSVMYKNKYLLVNILIFVLSCIFEAAFIYILPEEIYSAFFGFTLPFSVFNVQPIVSLAISRLLYWVLIFVYPKIYAYTLDRMIFDRTFDYDEGYTLKK